MSQYCTAINILGHVTFSLLSMKVNLLLWLVLSLEYGKTDSVTVLNANLKRIVYFHLAAFVPLPFEKNIPILCFCVSIKKHSWIQFLRSKESWSTSVWVPVANFQIRVFLYQIRHKKCYCFMLIYFDKICFSVLSW